MYSKRIAAYHLLAYLRWKVEQDHPTTQQLLTCLDTALGYLQTPEQDDPLLQEGTP